MEIIVLKNRDGPKGNVMLRFEPQYQRWSDVDVIEGEIL
jgi:replicative DNA helicase